MRVVIPNEHREPIVLVKSWTGGLAGYARGVAEFVNWEPGTTFYDTNVGSGAIFVQLKAFDKAYLRVVNDPRLLLLYEALKSDYRLVVKEAAGYDVDRDTFEKLKVGPFSPGSELYLRSLGYRGCWTGNHVRLRKSKPEHVAAWEHSLATMAAVNYKLSKVEFVSGNYGVSADIVLYHDPMEVTTGGFLLCKGYAGEGKLLRAFNKGMSLWRV